MALVFPWVLYIGIPVIIVLCLLKFKKKGKYKNGKKVANTCLVEETGYFKKLYKEYRVLSGAAIIALLISIVISWVMIARPAKVETVDVNIHNRDIFLCMDISDSVDELNLTLCDELKNVVKELDGERLGITIFNGQAVLLVPLTTDYQYVLDTLDNLKESFEASIRISSPDSYTLSSDEDLKKYYYKHEGTTIEEGSSFIGDGLASSLYNFPDLETNKERSRMIIFTTDNEVNGKPYVTLDEASALCKKNEVKVFGVAPDNVVDEGAFKGAVESTGGAYYKSSSKDSFGRLLEDIKKTNTSEMKQTKTIVTDRPELLFIGLIVCIGIYLLLSRKVKL